MQLNDFADRAGKWLSGAGPDSDIVISSRIRLARNLDGHRFLSRADSGEFTAIEQEVMNHLDDEFSDMDLQFIELKTLHNIDRCVLYERHLISRDHAFSKGSRGVAFNSSEDVAIMVNEEDHLRLQILRSGFQLREAWSEMDSVDSRLDKGLSFAFDPKYGYLTVCPTNVGTGLRASVMLHLPALVMTQQIEKVFQAVSKINLAVRGLYGEGTQALGDFYQISNQTTLGRSEEEIIENISSVIPQIIQYEREVRDTLVKTKRMILEDKIWRAFGALKGARIISSKETMEALSLVRMGINLGILESLSIQAVNELFVLSQPGHLQKMEGQELESMDRDIARARFIRTYLQAAS